MVNISSIIFRYDPHATQFINFSQLSDFIASLDSPLGIPKPNILALVSFDLPIAKGDKIHCLDVLHSLTKYTLGFVDDGDEDFGKVSFHLILKLKLIICLFLERRWSSCKYFNVSIVTPISNICIFVIGIHFQIQILALWSKWKFHRNYLNWKMCFQLLRFYF